MLILISNMRASRVNLLQNDYAAGLPSPLAFMGLGSSILHDLGFDRWAVRVLPVIHDLSVSEGRTKPSPEPKNGFRPVEIPEDLHGTVSFSLVIDLPEPKNDAEIQDAVRGKSLAGGVIFPAGHGPSIGAMAIDPDGSGLRRVRRGRAITPMLGGAGAVSFGETDTIRSVKAVLHPSEPADVGAPRGYLVPLAIGYRLLTRPDENPIPAMARDAETPHVFAEPGVGVGELISIRSPRLVGLPAKDLLDVFWRWSVGSSHLTAHPSYNPEKTEISQ